MFLQASVCPQGGGGVCLSACWDTTPPLGADTPPEQTPPGSRHPPEQTPPEQTPPQSRYPPGADTPQSRHPPQDTVTAADRTHPTGMHSC